MTTRRFGPRRTALAAVTLVAATALGGCGFAGVQSLRLPGGVGNGSDAIKLTVVLPDAGGLVPNNQVKVGNVAVGTINSLTTKDWHAVASISVEPTLDLPANSVAKVGVDSLLGSSYLELDPPPAAAAQARLASGMTIPLSQTHTYPSTEAVLSAASIVLNGGGVAQIGTITREFNAALNGNDHALRNLLPRVNSFIATLNGQKTQIYAAIDSLDRLSSKFAANRGVLTTALDALPPALAVLNREQPALTKALESLSKLGTIATPLVESTRTQLVGTMRDLVPALQQINSAGTSLINGLGFAVTFPFAPETVLNACRGDYCNLNLVLDLTNQGLVNGLTSSSGAITVPGIPGVPSLTTLGTLIGSLVNPGGLVGGLLSGGGLTSKPAGGPGSSGTSHGTPTPSPSAGLTGLLGTLLGGLGGSQ